MRSIVRVISFFWRRRANLELIPKKLAIAHFPCAILQFIERIVQTLMDPCGYHSDRQLQCITQPFARDSHLVQILKIAKIEPRLAEKICAQRR